MLCTPPQPDGIDPGGGPVRGAEGRRHVVVKSGGAQAVGGAGVRDGVDPGASTGSSGRATPTSPRPSARWRASSGIDGLAGPSELAIVADGRRRSRARGAGPDRAGRARPRGPDVLRHDRRRTLVEQVGAALDDALCARRAARDRRRGARAHARVVLVRDLDAGGRGRRRPRRPSTCCCCSATPTRSSRASATRARSSSARGPRCRSATTASRRTTSCRPRGRRASRAACARRTS